MHYQANSWGAAAAATERIERLVSESPVVIFSKSSCFMCHAMEKLFCGMGVNPSVYELKDSELEMALQQVVLQRMGNGGGSCGLPVVFVGGKLVGAMDRVMASHINGTLVPLLKQAGALWLWAVYLYRYATAGNFMHPPSRSSSHTACLVFIKQLY